MLSVLGRRKEGAASHGPSRHFPTLSSHRPPRQFLSRLLLGTGDAPSPWGEAGVPLSVDGLLSGGSGLLNSWLSAQDWSGLLKGWGWWGCWALASAVLQVLSGRLVSPGACLFTRERWKTWHLPLPSLPPPPPAASPVLTSQTCWGGGHIGLFSRAGSHDAPSPFSRPEPTSPEEAVGLLHQPVPALHCGLGAGGFFS